MSETTGTAPETEKPAGPPIGKELAKFYAYVHSPSGVDDVPGAETCEHAMDGACVDPDHMHAYIRLPNPHQADELGMKINAARARRRKMLLDPDTDAGVVFMADMDTLAEEATHEGLVDELVFNKEWADNVQAARDVQRENDPEYENIEVDMDRLIELEGMESRDEDEFKVLTKHVDQYTERVKTRREELRKPRVEAFSSIPREDLLKQVRDLRLDHLALQAAGAAGIFWRILVCTYEIPKDSSRPRVLMFKGSDDLAAAPQPWMNDLQLGFEQLVDRMAEGYSGND